MPTPEERARATIDAALQAASWSVQDSAQANLQAARGVALRNFPLKSGFGFADYLLLEQFAEVQADLARAEWAGANGDG